MTETVRMRILYVALKYDYGKLEQGYSFEHHNFYHSLLHMGHDILYFDFMTLMQEHGRESMNRKGRTCSSRSSSGRSWTRPFFGRSLEPPTP